MKALKTTLILSIVSLFGCIEQTEADLIVHNAHIYTVNDMFEKAEALVVDDGKIVAIGAEHEILNAFRASEKIDAAGKYIYPGFIDAHSHFMGYGIEKQRLDLVGTQSLDDVVEKISKFIAESDSKWVLGRGWDQNDWNTNEFPSNEILNERFPGHYIALKRVDGHAYLVNDNVLNLAQIDETSKVEGGKILIKNGILTGILVDEAMTLVDAVIPQINEKTKIEAIKIAQNDCLKQGLTSVCDAGLRPDEIDLINQAHQDLLKIRIYAMYSASSAVFNSIDKLGYETERLRAKSIKLYADGALGSRGAYLLEPYADDTNTSGLLIANGDSIRKWAELCKASGFQLNIHCIGDHANRIALTAMGKVLGETNDLRWRIEHAQVVHPSDYEKFTAFNIIPSMQPTHATSDMPWSESRLGADRLNYAYALKSLMQTNGLIALGTDFPVEAISPIQTFYSATIRKDTNGNPQDGFFRNEALTREDALKGITIWPAIANFSESAQGSLEIGKFADMVMLDRDILTCSENSILSTKVLKTWINGELVFER